MTTYEQSAVIGMWRSGADCFTIALVMGYTDWQVGRVIEDYKKRNK